MSSADPLPPILPDDGAPPPPTGLEARRVTRLAGRAVRRLRTLRARRDHGALSDEDYRRAVASDLEGGSPPSPGAA